MKIDVKLKLRDFCIIQFAIVTTIVTLGLFSYTFTYMTGHDSVFGILNLLDVGEEQSIPTYVSILNLLLASILIFMIYYHEKTLDHNWSSYWGFLAVLFLSLSLDESASIHEKFGDFHRRLERYPRTLIH